ncbi:cupin domain-containing protein [Anaerohalosphaeraceae bacterium U12dextr]|jgi:mannose-6-phosphate isomerase-like protein (cupin superfamily)
MEARKPFYVDLNDSQEYQRLMQAPQTLGMKAGRVFLGPGDECGSHSTEAREELLVFLNGRGQAVFGGKDRLLVGKGKVLYIPPHTQHNIVNTGSDPLVYVYCVAPVK